MQPNELQHHGILGMKWGVRRFQNKDGSLTQKGAKRYGDGDQSEEETLEARRARVLNSTSAKEIYDNRSILTTAEINERLNRIDTEKRLANVAESSKKSGSEYIDKALKIGKKANEVYEFTNSPLMKAIKKQITGEKTEPFNLSEVWKNRNNLTYEELNQAAKRVANEKILKSYMDDLMKSAAKANEKASTTTDENPASKAKTAESGRGTVEGEGTNSRTNSSSGSTGTKNNDNVVYADWRDVPNENVSTGRSFVAGLLEERRQ